MFTELDPTGGAGGDHRERTAVCDALDQLSTLFEDGEVSSKVGIENEIETEALECSNHFSFDIGADGVAEAFAETCTNGRCGLNDNVLCRVSDCSKDILDEVFFGECAGGTYVDALAAGYAGSFAQTLFECRTDVGREAAIVRTDDADTLCMLTNSGAAAAEDTLIVIAVHMSSSLVDGIGIGSAIVEACILDTEIICEVLKFTVLASDAGQALSVVVGENELHCLSAGIENLRGIGKNLHALGNGVYAGSDQTEASALVCLNDTHTAGADLVDFLQITEGGDGYACGTGGFEDCRTFRNCNSLTVNFYIYHITHAVKPPYYFLLIAPNLHLLTQAPHFTHFVVSIAIEASLCPSGV